jgi:WD40 repeat protein
MSTNPPNKREKEAGLPRGCVVIWCVGIVVFVVVGWWIMFVNNQQKAREEREREEAREREQQVKKEARRREWQESMKRRGDTWTSYPGLVDRVGFDGLDPLVIPEQERYSWQPDGLVGILGSHAGRHWSGEAALCVCYAANGKWIASGGFDGRVRIWDRDTLRELASLNCPLEAERPLLQSVVLSVACSTDGRFLAACGYFGLRVWKIEEDGFRELAALTWEDAFPRVVAFSADSAFLAAGGGDNGTGHVKLLKMVRQAQDTGWVQVWRLDEETLQDFYTYTEPKGPVYALAFSTTGTFLSSRSDRVRRWDLQDIWDLQEEYQIRIESRKIWTSWSLFTGLVPVCLAWVFIAVSHWHQVLNVKRGNTWAPWLVASVWSLNGGARGTGCAWVEWSCSGCCCSPCSCWANSCCCCVQRVRSCSGSSMPGKLLWMPVGPLLTSTESQFTALAAGQSG